MTSSASPFAQPDDPVSHDTHLLPFRPPPVALDIVYQDVTLKNKFVFSYQMTLQLDPVHLERGTDIGTV